MVPVPAPSGSLAPVTHRQSDPAIYGYRLTASGCQIVGFHAPWTHEEMIQPSGILKEVDGFGFGLYAHCE